MHLCQLWLLSALNQIVGHPIGVTENCVVCVGKKSHMFGIGSVLSVLKMQE